jgi:SAM-dependent methyltransferase
MIGKRENQFSLTRGGSVQVAPQKQIPLDTIPMLAQRLRSIFRKHLWFRRQAPTVNRSIALQQEIQFWRKWFATEGLRWQQDFRERFDPDQPIQDHVATFISRLETECVHILDVGSGPLTKLGKKHSSKQLVITATDLLAHEYDRLLAELNVQPPVRTIYADAERLVKQFGVNAYDIVHGQNCVDHMASPLRAIEQMVAVTKPHGFVVLYHAENEGQRELYRQLHQWDFTCKDGLFVIRDRHGRESIVAERLPAYCEVECRRVEDAVLVGIQKKA